MKVEVRYDLKWLEQANTPVLIFENDNKISEPGTGKSTALRKFASSMNPGLYKTCYFTLSTVTVMDSIEGFLYLLGKFRHVKK